jgi:hypothetical protein
MSRGDRVIAVTSPAGLLTRRLFFAYERQETIASNRSLLKLGVTIVVSVPAARASAANLSASILQILKEETRAACSQSVSARLHGAAKMVSGARWDTALWGSVV